MSSTLIIIAVTCVVSFLGFNNRQWIDRSIFWPPAIKRGQYYRFLSHGLVHADPQHLLFNMITLFFFGRVIEVYFNAWLGPVGFALFYVGGIVVAIIPSYLANRDNSDYRSLGASGAVSAVLFAFILINPWATIIFWFIPLPAILCAVIYVVYSIYMDRARRDNINHSAHLSGAAYGVLFTVLAQPRVIAHFLDQLAHPHFGR